MQSRRFHLITLLAGCLLLIGCSDDDGQQNQHDAGVIPDGTADASVVEVTYPETPAGEKLEWFVEQVNNRTMTDVVFYESFSPEFTSDTDYSAFSRQNAFLFQELRPLELVGLESVNTNLHAVGQFHGHGNDAWARIGVTVDATEPHRIRMFFATLTPDLDPAWGPIGSNEVGVNTWNPNTGMPTAGYTVELVDQLTGMSFVPPVTGTVDAKYEYARLEVPPGATEFGFRVTHADGTVTTTYSDGQEPGYDYLAPVFPSGARTAFLDAVGLTEDPTKANVWGLAWYWRPGELYSEEFMSTPPTVGCAQIVTSPSVPIYYSLPPSYLPTTDASETDPEWSTYWALNLDPQAYTFTADVGGGNTADLTTPALAADEWTVVVTLFHSDDFPQNPTPADCTP